MTLRDNSRQDFRPRGESGTESELMLGCAQRIADATELMAKDRRELERERDYWKGRVAYWEQEAMKARASRTALKGAVTRLKLRIARLEGET